MTARRPALLSVAVVLLCVQAKARSSANGAARLADRRRLLEGFACLLQACAGARRAPWAVSESMRVFLISVFAQLPLLPPSASPKAPAGEPAGEPATAARGQDAGGAAPPKYAVDPEED